MVAHERMRQHPSGAQNEPLNTVARIESWHGSRI